MPITRTKFLEDRVRIYHPIRFFPGHDYRDILHKDIDSLPELARTNRDKKYRTDMHIPECDKIISFFCFPPHSRYAAQKKEEMYGPYKKLWEKIIEHTVSQNGTTVTYQLVFEQGKVYAIETTRSSDGYLITRQAELPPDLVNAYLQEPNQTKLKIKTKVKKTIQSPWQSQKQTEEESSKKVKVKVKGTELTIGF